MRPVAVVVGDSARNPLPKCPPTPNCERRSIRFSVPADSLLSVARNALESMDPLEVRELAPNHFASVHRVVFFKDDMEFRVDPVPGGAVLHVRSASRVGSWDLGVNGRRVSRFVRRVRRTAARRSS